MLNVPKCPVDGLFGVFMGGSGGYFTVLCSFVVWLEISFDFKVITREVYVF